MLQVTKNNNKIKVELQSKDYENVQYNGDRIFPNNLEFKTIKSNGKIIRKYKFVDLSFNIIEDDIFGKTNKNLRFSGKLNEEIEIRQSELNNPKSPLGEIKMCGHDH